MVLLTSVAHWIQWIEFVPERQSIDKLIAHEESAVAARSETYETEVDDNTVASDLAGLYDWMEKHGGCIVNTRRKDNHWTYWGALFFAFSIATTIG